MINVVLILIFPFLFDSCSFMDCVRGSGLVLNESRNISNFNSINLLGSASVYIKQADEYSLEIEAEDNIIPLIETRVKGRMLYILTKKCINPNEPVKIFISLPELRSVDISGSGKIIGENVINSDKLELNIGGSGVLNFELQVNKLITEISGSGKVYLQGDTKLHNIILSGSGDIYAEELNTKDGLISLSGSGKCRVNVIENLDVNISGSGVVEYKGRPQINSKIHGSGKLKRLRE